jgi:hypothetical protein
MYRDLLPGGNRDIGLGNVPICRPLERGNAGTEAQWPTPTARDVRGPSRLGGGRTQTGRGTPAKTLEAGLNLRTVVIEFDSVESAVAAYNSPAYQAARKAVGRFG